jgi:hypothetical protein
MGRETQLLKTLLSLVGELESDPIGLKSVTPIANVDLTHLMPSSHDREGDMRMKQSIIDDC